MLKKFIITFVILLLIGAGSYSFFIYNDLGPKFPAEVTVHDEPPIEAARRFMNIRYETLEAVAKGYVLYAEQMSIAKIGNIGQTKNFNLGQYYSSEKLRPTKEIIEGFINSPEGAFIYQESKDNIKVSIRDKEKNIKNIYKSADIYATKVEKGLYPISLRYAYHGSYGAKQTIMNYDDELLYELLKTLKTLMSDANRQELWQAFCAQNENEIETIRKEFDEPISFFHRNNAKFKKLSQDELSILNLLIIQALLHYPYGEMLTILEDTGVNLYLGEELLRSLNNRVSSALKEVGKI